MTEHYTKNTISAAAWCAYCEKQTQHRVDGGRRGPCLECIDRREPAKPAAPPAATQTEFWK